MIKSIERSVMWNGRRGDKTWFHPRATMVPTDDGPVVFMTLQAITGSDVFGPVHWTVTRDLGKTWSTPERIPGLGRQRLPDGNDEGVCDVVPEFHPQTGKILALGHNVYYRDGILTKPENDRHIIYAITDLDGNWEERKTLTWDDPRANAFYSSNCSQRVTFDDGRVLLPVTFNPIGRRDRGVGALFCDFDGKTLTVVESTSDELRHSVKRGLLEPSLIRFKDQFFMTIRAESDQGYVAVSEDGLTWPVMRPWRWDDEVPLRMSSTQQHWLVHGESLWLIYTREAGDNVNVARWRAPLFMAKVDADRLRLIRDTERVVFPMIGDGVDDPANVARMGNFHPVDVTPLETWVTVGEILPANNWKGDTLLARIRWEE